MWRVVFYLEKDKLSDLLLHQGLFWASFQRLHTWHPSHPSSIHTLRPGISQDGHWWHEVPSVAQPVAEAHSYRYSKREKLRLRIADLFVKRQYQGLWKSKSAERNLFSPNVLSLTLDLEHSNWRAQGTFVAWHTIGLYNLELKRPQGSPSFINHVLASWITSVAKSCTLTMCLHVLPRMKCTHSQPAVAVPGSVTS